MNRFLSLIILILLLNTSYSQDTLPNFTLTERGNKVTVSWYNPYESVIQLNVQRSFDSLTNFKTVFSPVSPELQQNGFTEAKMPTNQIYYRIFYVLRGGSYFFTRSQRIGVNAINRDLKSANTNAAGDASGQITIKVRNEFYARIAAKNYRLFRDSILQKTKDTLNAINDSLVIVLPYTGPDNFRPSIYVYSNRDGVSISLPGNSKRFTVKFFEENGKPLFEIQRVKEPHLILDKENFYHAGWFLFELYEDDKLKEKNRFYLSKDF